MVFWRNRKMDHPVAKESQFGFIYNTQEVDKYILYVKKLEKKLNDSKRYSSNQMWKESVSRGHK